jgi:hypothetical protein
MIVYPFDIKRVVLFAVNVDMMKILLLDLLQ